MEWTAFFNPEAATVIPIGTLIMNLILALVIVVLGYVVGRIAGRIARKTIEALELKEFLKNAGVHAQPEVIGEHIIKYIVYVGAIIMALNQLGITPVVLNIIFAGIIAVVLIAIFLSLKDFIPNLISGIYIFATKKLGIGDHIKVNSVKGKVTDVNLIETTLQSDGHKIMIPNSTITKSQITVQKKL